MSQKITIAILLACAALLIGWDIYVAANPTPGDTISEITLAFAQKHPVLPFALGVIMGHLFWPQRVKV
jgi:hypothetical protein